MLGADTSTSQVNKVFAAGAIALLTGAIAMLIAGGVQGQLAPGRQAVPAPIDRLDLRVLESFPPRYVLNVIAGLPNGCAERYKHEVTRAGDAITVAVLNWMPAGDCACTMVYGTYELNIDLGSDFRSGVTYTVRVNDAATTFTAQ